MPEKNGTSAYDPGGVRLFVEADLADGLEIELDAKQTHYLINVMRLKSGARLRLFNGRDGEWDCEVGAVGKRMASLICRTEARAQTGLGDVRYLFAPLKSARLDFVAQKACEMGVSRISPVITERTQTRRISHQRIRANAIEAAEQCGLLSIPQIDDLTPLERVLQDWPEARPLIWCDEVAVFQPPLDVLAGIEPGPLGVLVGPEGGFSHAERARLAKFVSARPVSLGPRVLRADTAAVAVLALIQACLGDWS